ncbi:DNRLRE domain-containing protein [Paenibacillus sp. FSL L8-0435]|uniref:CBM96 family carbohydrate-binding protein n=1 Tax=Paenibacillus sp. FSL L8-0435 TaxID=2954618 RepID=UPI0030D9F5E9
MYYDDHDTEGIIYVKSPSNRFTSKYVLYAQDETNLESELVIATRKESTMDSIISIKSSIRNKDISSSLDVMYRAYGDLESTIEAIMFTELESSINVRPHNRAQGRFELIEAPRTNIELKPIGDATTRSRIDLQTINYGDTQRMMIGHDNVEEFESFVNFGDLKVAIPDLLYLEDAKLRLYYTGTVKSDANIEIYQPSTIWREYGITYANKPQSTQLLTNQYAINTSEKYVEINVLDVLKQLQDGSLINYGLNIKSTDNTPIYFNTRESTKPPILQVRYITSAVQSYGRSEIDSELIVYRKDNKDLNSTLTVKSDRGWNYLDSSIYVHRYEDPLFKEMNSFLCVNRPDVNSYMTVAIRASDELESSITIIENSVTELEASISTSKPDLASTITIDTKISMISEISIANRSYNDLTSSIIISKPDLTSYIEISNHIRANHDINSVLTIRNEYNEDLDSFITVSKPDTSGFLLIRGNGYSDIDGILDVSTFNYQDGSIAVSRPDMNSTLEIRYVSEQDGTIYIKDRDYLDSVIDIRQFSDLESTILIKQFKEIDSELTISKPDLGGYLYPRVPGINNRDAIVSIRKRDVSDMDSFILIKGLSSGAYYYIL